MNADAVIKDITAYVQNNIIVTIVLGIFVLFLLFRHPKVLFMLVGFGILAYGVARLFERLARTGLG